jgi:hypothetical protein
MAAAAGGAAGKAGAGFFSKIGQHIGRHKLAYGAGAAGLGALAYFGTSSSSQPKPQNGPSKDTYQSGSMF